MGWDILAYFDIDHNEIQEMINDHNIQDKSNWDETDVIEKCYKEKHLSSEEDRKTLHPLYHWNEGCKIHEMYDMYGTSFIRDDERFSNRRYQKELEKKVGKPFPKCLESLNWTLRTADDAQNVSNALKEFFQDDVNLMHFANWLRVTSKYCSTYELSY